MVKKVIALSLFVLLFLGMGICGGEDSGVLKNNRYEVEPLDDSSVEVRVEGVPSQVLSAEFTVMYSSRNPGFAINIAGPFHLCPRPFPKEGKLAQRWVFYSDNADDPDEEWRLLGVQGDVDITVNALGERTFVYRNAQGETVRRLETADDIGTLNPFLAGQKTVLQAKSASVKKNRIVWRFADQPGFSLAAELTLPAGDADPEIAYRMDARRDGYYSIAYTGCPWTANKDILRVTQRTSEGRHVNRLLSEAHMALPRVHVATKRMNAALVIDPKESPFRLVEDSKGVWTYSRAPESNSRFGMMFEQNDSGVRPVAFTPIMGGYESKMQAGSRYDFTLRYVLRPGAWEATYRYIARQIYDFRDMRDNSGPGSMNRTLENIMDYLSDRDGHNYCMWHDEQKYYNYWSDQAGIFKPFTPMFTLAAAIITDDEDFYTKHARPIVEYALSRGYNMFMPYDVTKTSMAKTANRNLGVPYPDTVQMVSLAGMFQHRTYAFRHYAQEKGFAEDNFMHALARYRLTGEKQYLDQAVANARGSGKTGYMDMLEIYEETQDPRHLDAAVKAAYRTMTNYNLFPAVPDEMITVDLDNKVPIHGHAYERHVDWGFAPPRHLYAPEQTVPAWRVSLIGTQWEVYRGGYWPWVHGQFMRLATHAQDDFMRDMQRCAMVGRYANYPGDFRSNTYSLVGELPDAPMHYIYETNFSTFNPGHACEWIGAVMDFLISDCFNRSAGRIDFPSQCMYGSGFRVKSYGDRAGSFYDEEGVRLWLPRRLLKANNKQVDYIAGYGNGKFYIAFWNQSFKPEDVRVSCDPALVEFADAHSARFWQNNVDQGRVSVADNQIKFRVPAKGIVAYAIDDAQVKTRLHRKMFDPTSVKLGPESVTRVEAPFGTVHAMLITMGRGLTTSFVYAEAFPEDVIEATLRYRQGTGPWRETTDQIFPYEFTTEIHEAGGDFQCILQIKNAERDILKSQTIELRI